MVGLARAFLLAPLLALSLFMPGRAGAATVVNFEGLPDGTVLSTQIAGMTFANAMVLTAGVGLNELEFPPLSGSNVAVDDTGPMELSFATPVQTLVLFATYGVPLQVTAYDHSGGTLLAQAVSQHSSNIVGSGDPGSNPNERFEIMVSGGFSFVRVTGAAGGGSFVIDDLTVTAVPEPSTPVLLLLGAGLVLVWTRRRARVASASAALLLAAASGAVNAQTVPTPVLSPAAVRIGAPASVLVSTRLGIANVLPGGVNVLRSVAGGAATVVGTLNDSGIDGDALAGDGVWAGRLGVGEAFEVRDRCGVGDDQHGDPPRGGLAHHAPPERGVAAVPLGRGDDESRNLRAPEGEVDQQAQPMVGRQRAEAVAVGVFGGPICSAVAPG